MKDQKPANKKEAGGKPEFKGRISSISCTNDVAEFRFEVENKKGEGHMFVEQAGNGAMLDLIAACLYGRQEGDCPWMLWRVKSVSTRS
jgi:hypothetical protein